MLLVQPLLHLHEVLHLKVLHAYKSFSASRDLQKLPQVPCDSMGNDQQFRLFL